MRSTSSPLFGGRRFAASAAALLLAACSTDSTAPAPAAVAATDAAPASVIDNSPTVTRSFSITYASGQGDYGAIDPLTRFRGAGLAHIVPPNPAWYSDANASMAPARWVSRFPNGNSFGLSGSDVATATFTLPSNATFTSALLRVGADNFASVQMGSVRTSAPDFSTIWGVSSLGLVTNGSNTLTMSFANFGGPEGLFWKLDVTGMCNSNWYYDAATKECVQDATPPSVVGSISPAPNAAGWHNTDATVSWLITEHESQVTTPDCTASTWGETAGTTVSCAATSTGGTTTANLSLKVDKTAPVVAFTGNQGTYEIHQQVTIGCSATDALSGIATSSCPTASASAYSLGAGSYSLAASATDDAGNSASATASYRVVLTAVGVCGMAQQWATNAGVANSLCAKANAGAWGAFRNEVKAQSGKKLSEAHASALLALVAGF